ncbi:hypothetical protein [Nocardia sp. NPDC058633]|uniref:hypothetical protein n=1 Tax=Nocardia sp. NPDC058633 TaxID=3346568 RepID=UPI00364FBA3B
MTVSGTHGEARPADFGSPRTQRTGPAYPRDPAGLHCVGTGIGDMAMIASVTPVTRRQG